MPEYEVVWQMTGSIQVNAEDEIGAKTQVDVASDAALVGQSKIDGCQVIAMREIK